MFAIKEEMGFEDHELKNLVLNKPVLLMLSKYFNIYIFLCAHVAPLVLWVSVDGGNRLPS